MDLDEETLAQLGLSRPSEWQTAVAMQHRARMRAEAKLAYEESAKGKATRARYNALYSTRPKRKQRRNRVRAKRSRTEPVLRGYARIKAWREKNPEKHAANEKRYIASAKGKLMKSRKNKRHYVKRKQR